MYALIDCRADSSVLSKLKNHGFMLILMPPAEYLSEGVASHADMLLFIGFGRLFCHADYYKSHKELILRIAETAGLELTVSQEPTGQNYPLDVLFNACIVGKNLICNIKTVSKLILNAAESQDYKIINVPQGYTKCSVCVVSENAVITSDRGIADKCLANGIDALLILEGHISLPPYNHGFIGGSSGKFGGRVYFCGSLDSHPDAENIKKFCADKGADIVELSEIGLQDVGTIFFI